MENSESSRPNNVESKYITLKETAVSLNQNSAKKRPQVYGYMKHKILKHMEEHGCSSQSVEDVIKASKFDKESILRYMNERAQLAQKHVSEECNSLCFKNIEKWLEYFQKRNLPESCLYEPALVINAIANNEDMPDPNELEGIDLKCSSGRPILIMVINKHFL
ncbi:uncharacterized protein [Eurosta solidaginis]|uniref:uncharacterized protein isoform X2 n=1 Tax=Eurosta solidaginis TaxID=178769 RepID=UPI0035309F0E